MNILVIGNGFDLEHNLPTKYTDFLDFVRKFHSIRFNLKNKKMKISNIHHDYIRKLFQQQKYLDRLNALTIFTSNNLWIKYFDKIRNDRLKNLENWIDFEREISTIISAYNNLIKYHEDEKKEENVNKKNEQYYLSIVGKIIPIKELTEGNRKINISNLLKDLNKLICALEIYVWDYIAGKELVYYSPSINDISVDKVLSFNYSDTFRLLYDGNGSDVEYCYVHGKATNNISFFQFKECMDKNGKQMCIKTSIESNNMVLGIDEYLPKNRRNKETAFIAFKKYYQRIYKRTGNEYKKWLQEIDNNVRHGINKINTVYIFGHSLDETDGDVLRELINHANIKTVVFYRDKEQLGQQIANLVKILKSDNVIEKVYGSNPRIEFIEQKKRQLIEGSDYDITSDIRRLRKIYNYNNLKIEQTLTRIKEKIDKEDLKYFYSQQRIISLFNELQKNQLGEFYREKLLKIAYKLMKDDKLKEEAQSYLPNWGYEDYDNSVTYDIFTQIFIDSINTYYKKNINEDKDWGRTNNKDDFYECKRILKDIFKMFHENDADFQKLWGFLDNITSEFDGSIVVGALENLIEESSNELDVIRYNHLLKRQRKRIS